MGDQSELTTCNEFLPCGSARYVDVHLAMSQPLERGHVV